MDRPIAVVRRSSHLEQNVIEKGKDEQEIIEET
jgi:hypothetical protein